MHVNVPTVKAIGGPSSKNSKTFICASLYIVSLLSTVCVLMEDVPELFLKVIYGQMHLVPS